MCEIKPKDLGNVSSNALFVMMNKFDLRQEEGRKEVLDAIPHVLPPSMRKKSLGLKLLTQDCFTPIKCGRSRLLFIMGCRTNPVFKVPRVRDTAVFAGSQKFNVWVRRTAADTAPRRTSSVQCSCTLTPRAHAHTHPLMHADII